MREITTHHDGHGLNESLRILADETGPGGASHLYRVILDKGVMEPKEVATIQFQEGPRNVEGSTPGITEAVLYSILMDRLQAFQAGPYPHPENAKQLQSLHEAMSSTKRRADERARRGVLGTNQV